MTSFNIIGLLNSEEPKSIELDLAFHVHQRKEQFSLLRFVPDYAVALSYLESREINSEDNLVFVDWSWLLRLNRDSLSEDLSTIFYVEENTYNSLYRDIAATNKTIVDKDGKTVPLFFKHKLPRNAVFSEITHFFNNDKYSIDAGFVFEKEENAIYSNYKNEFDINSKQYSLYYVSYVDENGNSFIELLESEPAVRSATWEDVDADTGNLIKGLSVYSKEQSASGWIFSFNTNGPWYIKPKEDSLIKPVKPRAFSNKNLWKIRFTNGSFNSFANGSIRNYSIPEFNRQHFSPYAPYRYSTSEDLIRINSKTFGSFRKGFYIKPEENFNCEIRVYSKENVLERVFTTSSSLFGKRYKKTRIRYEGQKINSWSNSSGVISLSEKIEEEKRLEVSFYYVEKDFEFSKIDFNPSFNLDLFNYTYSFYLIPDVNETENALHYLKIDSSGFIVEASQSESLSYPSLKEKLIDGTKNPNSIIGKKYFSKDNDCFVKEYCVDYENDNAYFLLCEVSIIDYYDKKSLNIVDVKEIGGSIKKDFIDSAIKQNHKILQSKVFYGENGQPVPKNQVVVVDVPITLLQKYGGVFTEEDVSKNCKKYLPANVYCMLNWVYKKSELSGYSLTEEENILNFSWVGPGLNYKIFRRQSVEAWVEIDVLTNPPESNLTFIDEGLESNQTYEYIVRVEENGVLLPPSNSVKIRTR